MAQIADRIAWAVETLDIQPNDHVLEIGCGHGVAVDLICQSLIDGRITAIDRSEKMIEAAQKRNKTHIAAGKAIFQATTLEKADFKDGMFNKIFAINLSLFWIEPAVISAIVKQYIAHGFTVREVLFKETEPIESACVIAMVS